MVRLSASSSRSSDRSSKEEREAFQKGGVLPDHALSALQQLQQHPGHDKPLRSLSHTPPQPPIHQLLNIKDRERERPSTQTLEAISSMRTGATPNLQAILDGSPPRSSSGTHTQGLMFRRVRSSAPGSPSESSLAEGGPPLPSRTCSHVSCPSNIMPTSLTTPTISSPQTFLGPPTSKPPSSSLPPSSKPPLNLQARPPCSTSHLPHHTPTSPTPGPLSAPTVPELAATNPTSLGPKNLPLAALRGHAAGVQGPGSKDSVGRARRLPKILVPPALLGLTTHPSLSGSTPEWQPDFGSAEAEGREGGDTAMHMSYPPLWEPPSKDEIQQCVKATTPEAPEASRTASQLLQAALHSPPSPNSSHPPLNTWSMGVHASERDAFENPLAKLSGDALPSSVQGRSGDNLTALQFPEDGTDASQYLEQGCREAASLNPSVIGGLSRAAHARTQQQQQQQQQQAEGCSASMPSSSAAAGEAASSSPPRTSRTGLDIRSNPLSCRSLGSSNQSPNSLHRLRESAWSVGLAALSPKKFGGSVRGRREGAKGSPLLSGLGQRRVGCEPCSSGNASERCAARTDVAGEHAGLNGVGGVQEGLARTSDATSARSSPSRVGQSHSQQQQHSLRDRGVGGTRSGSVHSELEQRKHQQGQGDAHGGGGGEDEVEVLYPLYLAESSFEGGRIGAISSESDVDSSSEMGMSVEGSGSQLWRAAGRAWLDGFSGCLGKATSPRAVPPSPGTPRHSLGKTTAVASSTDVTNPLATAEFFPVNPKASPIPDTVHKGYRVGRGSVEQQHRTLRGAQASPDRSSHQRTSNTIDAKRTDCCGVGMQLPGECDDDKEPQHLLTYLDRAARCSSSLNDPASEPHSQRLTLGAHHHTNLLSWLGQSLRRSRRIKPTCA